MKQVVGHKTVGLSIAVHLAVIIKMATRQGSQKEQEKCGQCSKAVMEKDLGIL